MLAAGIVSRGAGATEVVWKRIGLRPLVRFADYSEPPGCPMWNPGAKNMDKSVRSFTVELDVTRSVTVVIEAASAQEARRKASNLEYRHEILGEITAWRAT